MSNRISKTIRGFRDSIPSGYLLGRTDQGTGPAHLVKLTDFNAQVAFKVAQLRKTGFGFFDGGRYSNKEPLGTAIYAGTVTFPSTQNSSSVVALVAATATAVFTLEVDNVQVGTITFAAGALIGTVAWSPSPYTLVAGKSLQLFSPSTADVSLAFVTGIVFGDPA